MTDEERKTPLYARHVDLGARLTDFHGWEMPLWYPSGAVTEHRRVITNAGLFDTSHMSVVTAEGPDAFDLLQLCVTKDLAACVGKARRPLGPGDCVLGAYLDDEGECIDDTIVYRIGPEVFASIVNAGMGSEIALHLESRKDSLDVTITDLTGAAGKMDLQGPDSARILRKVLRDAESVLSETEYFTFKGHFDSASPQATVFLTNGSPVLVSRTGYSGEFGFEILIEPDLLPDAWDMILAAGRDYGLIPCGLAARDSLRAGAMLPLSHQDIGPWPFINHPWEFTLPFNDEGTGFTKTFIGDGVSGLRNRADHTRAFMGFDPRKVAVDDPAVVLDSDGREIGVVTTCVADMAVGRVGDRVFSIASPDRPEGFNPRGLVCGFVRVSSALAAGARVQLKDNRRKIDVVIVDRVRPDRTARRGMKEMM
jgi:aminomethyltransferase